MTEAPDIDSHCLLTTNGDIASINLESARRRSWSRFFQDPLRDGVAEIVVEHEQLTAQFMCDVAALDRLEALVKELLQLDAASARTALIQAQVASMTHRFGDARHFLQQAASGGAPRPDLNRLSLNVDQACGVDLDRVLGERRDIARNSGQIEELVALGALLADLREFTDADLTYRQALREYRDVSPFPVAWISFQLGVLWGEQVAQPQRTRAAYWYGRAVDCLPSYTKARVHLAEIYSFCGRTSDAEALLIPAVSSGDPEVRWRLADVLASQGKFDEAEAQMQAAHFEFESVLNRHLLAFADHGAEFYAGSGNNCRRALELACVNVANRPTLRAFEQAHAIALTAGDADVASELFAAAGKRWSRTAAFRSSPLVQRLSQN
jgi:tetratricopeptide (TPR) repeat protein